MQCPKCHFEHEQQTTECLRCGVIFSRFTPTANATVGPALVVPPFAPTAGAQDGAPGVAVVRAVDPEKLAEAQRRAHNEFICRIAGLPAALVVGSAIAAGFPTLSHILSMWLHEGGHAVTAWMCGYIAVPTAWFTIIGGRYRLFSLALFAAIGFGGYIAWRKERWFWVAAAVCGAMVVVIGAALSDFQAQGLFSFGGEAGRFFLGTALMLTFYARPRSKLRRHQARWGLLLVGAISFMAAYFIWAGGFERIADWVDEVDERGPSDMFNLTRYFGWSIGVIQARYVALAHWCMALLAAFYAWGIWDAMTRKQRLAAGDAEIVAEDAAAARPFDD